MEQINDHFIDAPVPSRKQRHTWLDRIPIGKGKEFEPQDANAAIQAAARHKRGHPGWNYTSRVSQEDGSVRIWRTA